MGTERFTPSRPNLPPAELLAEAKAHAEKLGAKATKAAGFTVPANSLPAPIVGGGSVEDARRAARIVGESKQGK